MFFDLRMEKDFIDTTIAFFLIRLRAISPSKFAWMGSVVATIPIQDVGQTGVASEPYNDFNQQVFR